jgi:putative mRNA 3-end processing factor
MLELTERGLYCPLGDFYIDPWRGVRRALITHAHGDHARPGSESYLTVNTGLRLLQARLGSEVTIETKGYGESITIGDVAVSFHPAGHILGSAQVRLDYRGAVWVVSGDYKTATDPTCDPFVPVRCHGFITEATFGLPIYRWRSADKVFAEINDWWRPELVFEIAFDAIHVATDVRGFMKRSLFVGSCAVLCSEIGQATATITIVR